MRTPNPGTLLLRISTVLVLANGCTFDSEPNPLLDEELPSSIQAELSNSDGCATSPADKTFTDIFPIDGFVSGTNYSNSNCTSAYLVDLNDYQDVNGEMERVAYGDTVPTTSSECGKLRVGVYVWQRSGNLRAFLGNRWRWGTWANNRCTLPDVDLKAELGLDGHLAEYRIAATARRHATSGDASSTYTRKKIRFYRDTNAGQLSITSSAQCWRNIISFRELSGYRAKPIAHYELSRAIGTGAWKVVQYKAAGGGKSFSDIQFEPAAGLTHRYRVRALNTAGEATPASNVTSVQNTAALCATPASLSARVLLLACESPHFSRTTLRNMLFSTSSSALSVANYIKEASYQKFSFTEASTSQWTTVPDPIPCGSSWDEETGTWLGEDGGADFREFRDELMAESHAAHGKPDIWLVVTNNAVASSAGGFDGVPAIFLGGHNFGDNLKWFQHTVHEIGHRLGLAHHGEVTCATPAFPTSTNLPTGCEIAAYGGYDPMGGKAIHYSALAKRVFGWIPESDVLNINVNTVNTTHRIPIKDLNSSSGRRLIVLRFPNGDRFYIDYRKPIGFNDVSRFGFGDGALREGLYVYYAPPNMLTCGDIKQPCLTVNRDVSLLSPATVRDYADTDVPVTDESRRFRVSMEVSSDGEVAAVIDLNQ
ncbi:MAG TPA: hypothetical protein VIM73_05060 [Polyangiaceae bacterium]